MTIKNLKKMNDDAFINYVYEKRPVLKKDNKSKIIINRLNKISETNSYTETCWKAKELTVEMGLL